MGEATKGGGPRAGPPRGNVVVMGEVLLYDGAEPRGSRVWAARPAIVVEFPTPEAFRRAVAAGRAEFTLFGAEAGGP